MQGTIDDGHSDSTGPNSGLPSSIVRAVANVGTWIRYGLIALIAVMALVATVMSVADIVKSARVTIADVLLLFIYLEICAMIFLEATPVGCRSILSSTSLLPRSRATLWVSLTNLMTFPFRPQDDRCWQTPPARCVVFNR